MTNLLPRIYLNLHQYLARKAVVVATVVPLLSMLSVLAPPSSLAAENVDIGSLHIGFVNSQRIINESPQAAKAKKKIEKDFAARDQDLQRMSKQLQALQENLDKNGTTMAESEHRSKEREFNDLNRDFQRKQREFREDLNLRQNEELSAIYENVNKIIRKVAETEKFDLILQEAVYFSPRIDITDKVIKALNEANK